MPCILLITTFTYDSWGSYNIKHHYLVPSTAQECHLNDARQTSCDHVHQGSESKKMKRCCHSFRIHGLAESCQVIIALLNGLDQPWQRQNLCFPSQEILNVLAIYIWVKIQICENHMAARALQLHYNSCSAAKLTEVHTFANLNSWTKKSYGCSLRKLIFQHLPESENHCHTKIIQMNVTNSYFEH